MTIDIERSSFRDLKSKCKSICQSRTPDISVISIDLQKNIDPIKIPNNKINDTNENQNNKTRDLSQDVDSDIISNFTGHCGKWQFWWTFLLSLYQLVSTFHIFAFVFQTAEKDFWCARPNGMDEMNVTDWKNLTQPNGPCTMLDIQYATQIGNMENFDIDSNLSKCENFEFSYDIMGITLVEEFSLVCDDRNLLSVVEMCFLAGAAIGSVSSGWISDKFGRRHTLMAFATIQTVIGTIIAFSTSLAMFMSLRVINGFASMTVTVTSFVLVVELVSGKWRTIIGILNILPVALSYIIASGIAYLTRDWRLMQLVISVPWFGLLFIWFRLPESPRWLLARGRLDELISLIKRAAKMNGRTLPTNYRKQLEACSKETMCNMNSNGTNDLNASPLVVVFSKRYWRTTVLTLIVWLTLIIMYFGLTLHLSNLGGNIYWNTAIAGLVEAVSICLSIIVVLKMGIRRNLVAYMLISGMCCLLVNIIPDGNNTNLWAVITLAMIAKCAIGASNAIIPTFTAQQYPTVVRNFGVGMGNLAAGIGLILVPYIWLLEHIQALLPMTVMGICGVIGAVALMLMKDNAYQD